MECYSQCQRMSADIANDKTVKKLQRWLIDVNDQLLTEVIDILQPFDDGTRMMSADKHQLNVDTGTHPVQASADIDSDPPLQKKLKHDGDITTYISGRPALHYSVTEH